MCATINLFANNTYFMSITKRHIASERGGVGVGGGGEGKIFRSA